MGNFCEDLRRERIVRGIALEDITAVTKISQRNLLALEEGRFRQLPGGILNKGIVRSYAGALGLDQEDWTARFVQAYNASGQAGDQGEDWAAFASNVGKARMLRHDAAELRLRWAGAALVVVVVAALGWLTVRLIGTHAGWWHSMLPESWVHSGVVRHAFSAAHSVAAHLLKWASG